MRNCPSVVVVAVSPSQERTTAELTGTVGNGLSVTCPASRYEAGAESGDGAPGGGSRSLQAVATTVAIGRIARHVLVREPAMPIQTHPPEKPDGPRRRGRPLSRSPFQAPGFGLRPALSERGVEGESKGLRADQSGLEP